MDKYIVLATGPPGNGRDEYIQQALPILRKTKNVGYHHVFAYMQKVAPTFGVPNLTRNNVFNIAKERLDNIRNHAFNLVITEIASSDNDLDIVSTPAIFRVRPWADYNTGEVDGLTLELIQKLNPALILVIIDDLLRVRESLLQDPHWSDKGITLTSLADSRQLAISLIVRYCQDPQQCKFLIIAKAHPVQIFVDVLLHEKPLLYVGYRITGESDFRPIHRFIEKLSTHFVCIDPYAIKDWRIVQTYDDALEDPKMTRTDELTITVPYSAGDRDFSNVPVMEIEEAIDMIRNQIVHRDLLIITCTHATVIHHNTTNPSYGVMTELIHSATEVMHPVYVLYPFKKRLSPFFEHFLSRKDRMLMGEKDLNKLEDELIEKMIAEYPSWTTWE